MDNFKLYNVEQFKELPQQMSAWWKMCAEVFKQMNTDIFKNVSVFTRSFSDNTLGHIQNSVGVYVSSPWWFISLATLFIITLPIYFTHYRTQKRLRAITSNIPGPVAFPILGNVPTFAGCNLEQFFQKLVKLMDEYGSIVRFWMQNKLYIVISDPDNIEFILTNKHLTKKSSSVSKIVNGNGVMKPDDEKWKIHRRIISSTFNTNVLEQFMDNFAKNSFVLVERLKKSVESTTIDIYQQICLSALDIICETTMGTNVNIEMEEDPEFQKNILNALETLGKTFKKPWMLNEWLQYRKQNEGVEEAMRYVHKFVDKVITEKIETKQNGFRLKKEKQQVEYVQWVRGREISLLELLIQDEQLSMEEIRDELSTLIVAGTKMAAITCCYALSLLGEYQDVQSKIQEEQDRIFGPDKERLPTSMDLICMRYLEKVIKETLRLYPPVPFLFRKIEDDTKLENGYILPSGCYAVIFNYITHRNPDYFPDPDRFNPDRFTSETEAHPFSYIPFGGGRRICVAYKYGMMEIKTLLSTILRRFYIDKTTGGIANLNKQLQAGVILKPAHGFNVKILPRRTSVIPSVYREE